MSQQPPSSPPNQSSQKAKTKSLVSSILASKHNIPSKCKIISSIENCFCCPHCAYPTRNGQAPGTNILKSTKLKIWLFSNHSMSMSPTSTFSEPRGLRRRKKYFCAIITIRWNLISSRYSHAISRNSALLGDDPGSLLVEHVLNQSSYCQSFFPALLHGFSFFMKRRIPLQMKEKFKARIEPTHIHTLLPASVPCDEVRKF